MLSVYDGLWIVFALPLALIALVYCWLFSLVLLLVEVWRGRRAAIWLTIVVALGWAGYFVVVSLALNSTLFRFDQFLTPTFAIASALSRSGLSRKKPNAAEF